MGFILTKWYVNYIKAITVTVSEVGFILTKWYVNNNEDYWDYVGFCQFYIN